MVRSGRSTLVSRLALAGPTMVAGGPATAHGIAPVTPGDLWLHWTVDPLVVGPLLLAHWLYGRGFFALRRLGLRRPAVPAWRAAIFLAGEASLVAALVSPLDALSGTLLSAHMAQHLLLVSVAPPLLVLGRPEVVCFFGLAKGVRRWLARDRLVRCVLSPLAVAARPLPATVLHGAALWVWHLPGPFEAAAAVPGLHWLEHLCFFGTALLFWHALIACAGRAAAAAAGALAALVTLLHSAVLSALMTLSPQVLYANATAWAPLWGLSPLEDQQLAGVLMWVPAGAAYLAAGLVCAARLLVPWRSALPPRVPVSASGSGAV